MAGDNGIGVSSQYLTDQFLMLERRLHQLFRTKQAQSDEMGPLGKVAMQQPDIA